MIHIENTPNPNALKFLSEKKISSVGTQEFQKANINKICNYFSWQPNTNLNTGLKKYLIKLKNENSSSNN